MTVEGFLIASSPEITHPAAVPPRPEELLRIGEVAERVGLSLRTVRFYEEKGLFTPSARTQGGFRQYSEADVQRLRVLKGMKPLGLSLEQIRELMALFDSTDDLRGLESVEVRGALAGLERYAELAAERVAKLERHLMEVRRLRERVRARVADCRGFTE